MLAQHLHVVYDHIEKHDWPSVREAIVNLPEPEIAELLFEIEPAQRMIVFRLLPRELAGEVFAQMEKEQQNELLQELTQEETRRLLEELTPDDRTSLLEELPGQATQRLLNLLSPEDLKQARQLLGYPPESVGRLMTPDYVALRPEWTIQQALDHIRAKGHDSETIDTVYVTDNRWKLLDAISLRRIILADSSKTVADVMDYQYVCLEAHQDREEAVRFMERYDLSSVPIVDRDGILLGIVTFDDVMDVAVEEVTEDFHKAAAVAPLKENYRGASVFSLYRKRIGWLLALVFTNVFSGAAIASFEEIIAANVALVFFLPLLIDSSGNAGSQSATLAVRALATGEIKLSDWLYLVGKEIFTALLLGLTMALAVSLVGLARGGAIIGLIVSLTMICTVMFGSIIGLMLPFLLSRLKFDPATASAPLITTLADISGVLIYFSIATLALGAE
ncbi:MAG: magnesium transporter [Anaerolineae bacterium]|nr:magnesium transporter [Anaerolineae bacterium]MDW8171554.1 magnesium transporter [Anaerolineae bacterium]